MWVGRSGGFVHAESCGDEAITAKLSEQGRRHLPHQIPMSGNIAVVAALQGSVVWGESGVREEGREERGGVVVGCDGGHFCAPLLAVDLAERLRRASVHCPPTDPPPPSAWSTTQYTTV